MSITHSTAADGTFSASGSTAWNAAHNIDDNTLAAAKLAASASSRLFGRSTAGAGAGEELTAAQAKAILAIASGDVSGLGSLATLNTVNNGNWSGTALALANGGTGGTTLSAANQGLSSVYVISKSFFGVSCGADTNEDALAQITLPALGANDILRVTTKWTHSNNANNKTQRIRLGGSGGTDFLGQVQTTSTQTMFVNYIGNVNSTSVQNGFGQGLRSTSTALFTGNTPGTVSTGSAGVVLYISGQKASSGDVLTLDGYVVEILSNGS